MPDSDPSTHAALIRDALPAGEVALVALRPARRSILLRSMPTLGGCLALGVLALMTRSWISPWHGWVLGAAASIAGARIVWEVLVRQSRLFACSERRVVARFGVLSRGAIDLPWVRVQQVIVRRTLLERLFGLGTLGFATASGGVDLAWVGVARPWALHSRTQALVPGGCEPRSPDSGNRQEPNSPAPKAPTPATVPPAPPAPPPSRPLVIGLAGGIGSGKSEAAAILRELGWVISDSDSEARQELQAPDVRETLRIWWGESILDASGGVDRAAVARIVFGDPAERRRLEGLVHPRLRAARERLKAQARERGVPGVVIDAPLLFEAGLAGECDAIIFIDTPRPVRLERLGRARGWTEEELARREAAQMPLEEKKQRCDTVITNDGDAGRLRAQVERAARELLARGPRRIDTHA